MSCHDMNCPQNCCNYYGHCPNEYDPQMYDSYYSQCFYQYDEINQQFPIWVLPLIFFVMAYICIFLCVCFAKFKQKMTKVTQSNDQNGTLQTIPVQNAMQNNYIYSEGFQNNNNYDNEQAFHQPYLQQQNNPVQHQQQPNGVFVVNIQPSAYY